jgi:glycosyltransferase involved in cell wall biosynthesis
VKRPKVTVCVVTYNQEKYIGQCLQSIVDQETNFDFEVLVADDCSVDGTREIIKEFVEKYPGMVKPIFHERNIGAYKNFIHVHSIATGNYIAHLDGDDYALPGKLTAQVNFLDNHIGCNIVFHRVLIEFNKNSPLSEDLVDIKKLPPKGFCRSDVIRHITVGANSSKMYRRVFEKINYPEFKIVDYFETVLQISKGTACYVDEKPYGVYRAGIGIATSGLETKKAICDSLDYFSKKYPEERAHIGAAALLLFLIDAKNRRNTWKTFLKIFVENFTFQSIWLILKDWPITKMLRLPKQVIENV